LWGKTAAGLAAEQAELLVLVQAFDNTFRQTVHGRYSYTPAEVEWGARFEPAFRVDGDGALESQLAKPGALMEITFMSAAYFFTMGSTLLALPIRQNCSAESV
jgi:inward rectifier potassium channel